jgi:outer membrane protein TolC
MVLAAADRVAVALAIALLGVGAAWCAEAPPEAPAPRVVTLDEALAAAESTPEVIVAHANERVAAAGIRTAKAPAEPSLTLATKTITARESVAVSIPFRWGGQRSAAVSAAEAELDAAARSGDAAIAAARRACRVAWFTLAAAEDSLRAAIDAAARPERNRAALVDLFELQRASRLDVAQATTEAVLATAARADAEKAVIAASAELRALLGLDMRRLSAGDARPMPPPEGALEPWQERARAFSPDVAVAESELRAAEARVTQRRRERRPLTSFETGADWNDPTQPGTDASFGLALTFPTRGRAAWDAAQAERDRAAARLDLARRRIEADVETAWSSTVSARARFEALDQVARPAALEAVELTELGYREGKLDLFRILVAQRQLADTERDRAAAYRDWGTAYADLERLTPGSRP